MPLPEPREDLGLREGYHSQQVDVEVRLNTNESPLPPPDAWLQALRQEVEAIRWNRYPDRHATELRAALASLHGVRADQVFCANGSNEVLQSLCLAYGGAGRSVAVFEPTYALHSHIAHLTGTAVAEGQRRPDFSLDLNDVARRARGGTTGDHVPVLPQQPDRPGGRSGHRAGRAGGRAGAARGGRGLRPVRRLVGPVAWSKTRRRSW